MQLLFRESVPAPLDIQWPKCLQFQGASPPWSPDQGLCPWTPLGALPQTPRYRLVLRTRHGAPNHWSFSPSMALLWKKSCGRPCRLDNPGKGLLNVCVCVCVCDVKTSTSVRWTATRAPRVRRARTRSGRSRVAESWAVALGTRSTRPHSSASVGRHLHILIHDLLFLPISTIESGVS